MKPVKRKSRSTTQKEHAMSEITSLRGDICGLRSLVDNLVDELIAEIRTTQNTVQQIAEASLPKLISRVIDKRTPTLSETILGNILDLQLELRRHLMAAVRGGTSPYAHKYPEPMAPGPLYDESVVKSVVEKSRPERKPPAGPIPEPPAVIPAPRWGRLPTELL